MKNNGGGYTLVELMLTIVVLAIMSLGAFDLFVALLHSAIVAQRQATASTLATNQMEYLKSLPYDNLAVAGGPIVSTSTIPASFTKKVEGVTYTIKNNISFVDDAYDGCGSYPTLALKKVYCRNYPPPTGAPSVDTNPADYKDVNVTVKDNNGIQLANLDTQVAALVAETASNTGALFIYVVDDSGNPITNATVNVVNSSVTPNINISDLTDENGIVIFYDLPPSTTGNKYTITASLNGYSTLSTIAPSGTLQPTYSSQNLISQSSSYVTLTLKPQGANSLVVETADTNGNDIAGVKVYIKGGYKKYILSTDTSYYYDNMSPSDVRPTSDENGLFGVSNLVPGNYILCGDAGATSCTGNNKTYYLAAAVPYGGLSPLEPVVVPTYLASSPPATTFSYNGVNYLQKVRLLLSTSSTFPRVYNLAPYDVSIASGTLANYAFTINGTNLPCSSNASSCTTKVSFIQGSNTFLASCTGAVSGLQLNCTANLTNAVAGNTQLVVTVGSNTLTLPASPMIGGAIVTP